MFKRINKFLWDLTFEEKKLFLKDFFFTDQNENITRVIKLIKTLGGIKNNNIIVDIGAFDGQTAKLFSSAFPKTLVYAYEANPEAFKTAVENCKGNTFIQLQNCAISDKSEKLTLNITSNNVSSSLNKINEDSVDQKNYKNELNIKKQVEVPAQRLDELLENKEIQLLKIDTQGHELNVLNGSKNVLKRTHFVLIEMSNHTLYINGCKYYDVDEWMRVHGFILIDLIVTYRKGGIVVSEYDAIYANGSINTSLKN